MPELELQKEFYNEDLQNDICQDNGIEKEAAIVTEVASPRAIDSKPNTGLFDPPQLAALKSELKAELKSELLSALRAEIEGLISNGGNSYCSLRKFIKEELRSDPLLWQLLKRTQNGEIQNEGNWQEQDFFEEDINGQLIKRKGAEMLEDYKRGKFERGRLGGQFGGNRQARDKQKCNSLYRLNGSGSPEPRRRPLSQENGSCHSKESNSSDEEFNFALREGRAQGGFVRGRGRGGYRGGRGGGYQVRGGQRGGYRGRGGFQGRGGYRGRGGGGGFVERSSSSGGGGGSTYGARQGSSQNGGGGGGGGDIRGKRNFRWRGGSPGFKENRNPS